MQIVVRAVRKRPWLGIVASVAILALVVGLVAMLFSPSTPAPAPTQAAPVLTPEPSSTPSPTLEARGEITLGEIIATTAVEELSVFSEPAGETAFMELSQWSDYGQYRTLLVDEATVVGDEEWFHVLLPLKPNGQTGWVRSADVTVTSTEMYVEVDLEQRLLTVFDGDEAVLVADVAVGTSATPTPTGMFYVTDPLDLTANPTGVYGAYAIGLSGYSDVLDTFNGAPPQIAIHGTNQPHLLGQPVSNGCIRVTNDEAVKIADLVVLGTPVLVK